jgi:predicted MFS family arabinose efflux permease
MGTPARRACKNKLNPGSQDYPNLTRTIQLQILLLAVLRTLLNTGYRMVYPFLSVFARGMGVEITAISQVLSVRALSGALGPFLATVTDTRGRKTGILLGLGLFTFGFGFVAVYPHFWTFALAMILATLGKAVFDTSLHAYAGDQVPYQRRATAVAIIEVSWSVSFILGIPLAGFLIGRFGWSSPFGALGALSFLSILVIQLVIPSDRARFQPVQGTPKPAFLKNLKSVLTYGPALAGLAFGICLAVGNETINIIFGVWIEDSFGLQLAALGIASVVIGLSELSGEGLVWLVTDRLGKIRAIAIGIGLNIAAALLLPVIGQSLPGALVGLFLYYITFEFTLVSSIPLLTELLPEARATLLAANSTAFLLGRAAGAWLAAPIFASGIWASSLVVVGFNLIAIFFLSLLFRAVGDRLGKAAA